jgi:hypothetical protein
MNGLYFDHFLLLEVLLQNIDRHDISIIQNDITINKFLFLSVDMAPVTFHKKFTSFESGGEKISVQFEIK